jgi:hypothetical protein
MDLKIQKTFRDIFVPDSYQKFSKKFSKALPTYTQKAEPK